MAESGRSKDAWDKADILGKLLSGVVLAVIAFVIKSGTDDIAASQQRGELVRSLIADLTTKEQRTRQDLALIALNHSVGDDRPDLVIEIAARLASDTTGYAAGDDAALQALGSVAFQILRQRAPARADSLKEVLQRRFEVQVSSDSTVRAALRSAPDTGSRALPPASGDSAARAASAILAPLSSRVVYIQFQGTIQRAVMEKLRQRFSQTGLAAPGVERIATPFTSSVRYFHPDDRALADSAAALTRAFLRDERVNVPEVPVQDLSARRLRVPRGQIEVWVSVR
jgi:hypothetical protein